MWFLVTAIVVLVAVAALVAVLVHRGGAKKIDPQLGRQKFCERREWLEADFFKLGSTSGSPRGLNWVDCDFSNEVSYAIDKRTGELTALVGVGIQFEAIEGGGMEDVENVANAKAATAMFRFDGEHWQATGKTVFNLSPSETIQYYQNELETLEI